MEKIKIAILGASEIAYRRFLPALKKDQRFEYIGVAYEREQDAEKVLDFKANYGGCIFTSFNDVFNDPNIDAVYVPQPPAFHFSFGKRVLESGKHLFMEKPFTIDLKDTLTLISLAKDNDLGVVENYMFRFHKQIKAFQDLALNEDLIGKVKKYEVRFSFPRRATTDFRYNKKLGGGALFDCGGYTIMLSDILLARKGQITAFTPLYSDEFEVDIGGEGRFESNELICNFSFGMDNPYFCFAKAFGEKGILAANRVLTAPSDFDVNFDLLDSSGNTMEQINIGVDNSFLKSIDNFYNAVFNSEIRKENYEIITRQAEMIEKVKTLGGMK